jgi:hypothetical protein
MQTLCRRQNDNSYDRESYQGAKGSKKYQYLSPTNAELLGLFVWGMLAASIAELRKLKPAGSRLFVLRRRVIPLFAFRTLKGNYFTHKSILTDPGAVQAPEICPVT